jgi:hypothetical protein
VKKIYKGLHADPDAFIRKQDILLNITDMLIIYNLEPCEGTLVADTFSVK